MLFSHKRHYGKDYYYPINKKAENFLKVFPGSSGVRKCLTIFQFKVLKKLGVELKENKLKIKGHI